MFLSFPIIAEAPIPLPEILDEPSLEEPSIRETEPAANEVTYEIVEQGSRQRHRKLIALCTNDVTKFRPPSRQTKSNSVREVGEMYANGE